MSPFSFIIIQLILKFFVKKKKFLNRARKFFIYKWNMYGIKELGNLKNPNYVKLTMYIFN